MGVLAFDLDFSVLLLLPFFFFGFSLEWSSSSDVGLGGLLVPCSEESPENDSSNGELTLFDNVELTLLLPESVVPEVVGGVDEMEEEDLAVTTTARPTAAEQMTRRTEYGLIAFDDKTSR